MCAGIDLDALERAADGDLSAYGVYLDARLFCEYIARLLGVPLVGLGLWAVRSALRPVVADLE